jgi:hypothetical protein
VPETSPWEEPERLLVGSDRPRPLPPALRSRLEELLTASGSADSTVKPLPDRTRRRLQGRLAARRRWRKWGALSALGAAAAAVAAVVALAVPPRPVHPVAAPTRSGALRAPFGLRLGASSRGKSRPSAGPLPYSPTGQRPAVGRNALGREHAAAGSSGAGEATGAGESRAAKPAPWVPVGAVVSVFPREGPAKGGNWVLVKGNDVGKASEVYFGQAKATRLEPVAADEVRALAPAHAPGTVTVTVAMGSPAAKPHAMVGAHSAVVASKARARRSSSEAEYTFAG